MPTLPLMQQFAASTISTWLTDNLDRCNEVQAFGAQIEHWFKAELAVTLRRAGLQLPQPLAVDVERKPAQYGNPGVGRQSADILLAAPEPGRIWPSTQGPRLWVELKMRTHFYWRDLEEDRGKWARLSEHDAALYVMLTSYRHRENGDIPSLRRDFERRTGLTPAVAQTSDFEGWTCDEGRFWPYHQVTHCLYMCSA